MEYAATSVDISAVANATLGRLTERLGDSKSGIVEAALEAFEAQIFAGQVAAAYAELQENEPAWQDYMNEVAVWDKLAAESLPNGDDW